MLAKDSHQIRWDNGVLKMTVCLLTDDTTGQVSGQNNVIKVKIIIIIIIITLN